MQSTGQAPGIAVPKIGVAFESVDSYGNSVVYELFGNINAEERGNFGLIQLQSVYILLPLLWTWKFNYCGEPVVI